MRRIFLSFVALLALVSYGYAQGTPKTKAQLNTEVGVDFADNTTGAITPALLRAVINDIVASYLDPLTIIAGANITITGSLPGGLTIAAAGGGGSVANPTATIGLTPVNGSASSATRSDGAPPLSQAITPVWTGIHAFTNDARFKNGEPWADVKAWGAVCNNVTDDTAAIQSAIASMNAGGGTVYFPPGACKITSTLFITGSVCLVGTNANASSIQAQADFPAIDFSAAVSYGCIEKLSVFGYVNNAATNPTVFVHANAVVNMRDCRIWGGGAALYTLGVDGVIENCFIGGAGTGPASGSIVSQGANWYVRVKVDTVGVSTTSGFYQANPAVPGTILENHFVQCDFSGSYTYSVKVDDAAGNSAIMVFDGSVFNSPINIANAKWVAFNSAEIGNTTLVHGAGALTIGNSFAFSATTVSGAGVDRHCANNKNITC